VCLQYGDIWPCYRLKTLFSVLAALMITDTDIKDLPCIRIAIFSWATHDTHSRIVLPRRQLPACCSDAQQHRRQLAANQPCGVPPAGQRRARKDGTHASRLEHDEAGCSAVRSPSPLLLASSATLALALRIRLNTFSESSSSIPATRRRQ
jgi:hypothetical protein